MQKIQLYIYIHKIEWRSHKAFPPSKTLGILLQLFHHQVYLGLSGNFKLGLQDFSLPWTLNRNSLLKNNQQFTFTLDLEDLHPILQKDPEALTQIDPHLSRKQAVTKWCNSNNVSLYLFFEKSAKHYCHFGYVFKLTSDNGKYCFSAIYHSYERDNDIIVRFFSKFQKRNRK